MQLSILFFASFKEQLSIDKITYEVAENTSIAQLCQALAQRGDAWQAVFSSPSLLVAVNQSMVELDHLVCDNDEFAFFPPVTGG